jgi:hypothetical protein
VERHQTYHGDTADNASPSSRTSAQGIALVIILDQPTSSQRVSSPGTSRTTSEPTQSYKQPKRNRLRTTNTTRVSSSSIADSNAALAEEDLKQYLTIIFGSNFCTLHRGVNIEGRPLEPRLPVSSRRSINRRLVSLQFSI